MKNKKNSESCSDRNHRSIDGCHTELSMREETKETKSCLDLTNVASGKQVAH